MEAAQLPALSAVSHSSRHSDSVGRVRGGPGSVEVGVAWQWRGCAHLARGVHALVLGTSAPVCPALSKVGEAILCLAEQPGADQPGSHHGPRAALPSLAVHGYDIPLVLLHPLIHILTEVHKVTGVKG